MTTEKQQDEIRQITDVAIRQCLKFRDEFPNCWPTMKVTLSDDVTITVGLSPSREDDDA